MKLLAAILFLTFSVNAVAQSEKKQACNLCPDFAQAQFAGTLGFVSAGAGYEFFNDNLRTALLYGYVPKQFTGTLAVHLLTLKATARVIRFQPNGKITLSPYVGATGTLEPNRHSILILPERYPDNYYGTTAFHFTAVGGLNVAVPINAGVLDDVELYGELVALDTMFGYRWQNENVGLNRVLSAAFGLVVKF